MIRIVDPGPQTTVQDLGRTGQLRYGIPPSGPLDRDAFLLANRLVGNDDGAAALECTFSGPRFRVEAPCAIAVTGAEMPLAVNGEPRPLWATVALRAGDAVKFGVSKVGARSYLAFSGGIDVPLVLGSRATYLRGRLGGHEGRALARGDVLRIFPAAMPPLRTLEPPPAADSGSELTVRVVLGPQADRFTDAGIATFLGKVYEVMPQSDRMGVRLSGPRIEHRRGHDIISDGIALGSIQVPGDGLPIVLLVDRQSTGGYTKIATVCSFDIGKLGQQAPGRRVRFRAVAVKEAHQLLREHQAGIEQPTVEASGETA